MNTDAEKAHKRIARITANDTDRFATIRAIRVTLLAFYPCPSVFKTLFLESGDGSVTVQLRASVTTVSQGFALI